MTCPLELKVFLSILFRPVIIASLILVNTASGGTVRYLLPELLGELNYDGTYSDIRTSEITTPFGYYTVSQARLVIEGTFRTGKAHGDGIIFEGTEFEVEPGILPGFRTPGINRGLFNKYGFLQSTSDFDNGAFRFDKIIQSPFTPGVTPLPCPCTRPPISFSAGLGLTVGFLTNLPPRIDPNTDVYLPDGIIFDSPIVVNVTKAFIEFSGAHVVPEPATSTASGVFCLFGVMARFRHRRSSRRKLPC